MKFLERLARGLLAWDRENKPKALDVPPLWEDLSHSRKLTYECQAERIRDVLRGMKEEEEKK